MMLSPGYRPSPPGNDALTRFFMNLRRVHSALSLHDLISLVASSGLSRADLEDFLTLDDATYAHREMFRSPSLEVGCIGWRRGQRTPIHDHADSVCAVVVLDGVLTNTEYGSGACGRLVRGETRRLGRGEMIDFGHGAIHSMGNEQRAALFTLHVYSPPLPSMHERTRPDASVRPRPPGETP